MKLLEVAEDVFQNDNRVVNNDADRQRQSQQRHVVERESRDPHQGKRRDDRGRNRQRRDQHRAPVADEEQNDQARQQTAQQQMFFQRRDRRANEQRLIADDVDRQIVRDSRAQFLQLVAYGVHDFHRVSPRLPPDLQRDRRLAVEPGEAARLFVSVLDAPQVGDFDRRAGRARNDQIAELLRHVEATHRAHRQLFRALKEPAAGGFDVFVFQRAGDLIDGDAMAVELFGVEQDLNLTVSTADDVDRRDAVDGLQCAFDLLIRDFGDLAQRARAADDQRNDRV